MSSSQNAEVVNILKRRCEVLEEQLALASEPQPKSVGHTQVYAGRPVRRLVSFFDGVRDLIEENDRRMMLEVDLLQGEGDGADQVVHTIDQNRLLRGYKELVLYVPLVKGIADGSCEDVTSFYKNLGKGSDMARGDDTASLKVAIIQWVQDLFGVPDQPLQAKHKAGRGLDHDQCGRLLCPIEFDWMDLSVRAKIRDGHPDYAVTAHSWPLFLYAGFQAQVDDVEKGLFRSALLIKAYRHVFTSPTSVTDQEVTAEHLHKRRKTVLTTKKSTIAVLTNLREVTPRSIAYIAVQVRFALSSLNSWNEVDADFSHRDFYNAIVDYFEVTTGPVAQRNSTELLHWWNKQVFRRSNRQSQMSEAGPGSSVRRLAIQRAAKEVVVD